MRFKNAFIFRTASSPGKEILNKKRSILIDMCVRLETAIPLLLRRIKRLEDHGSVSIAFPDDGAYKRFNGMFDGYELITCSKRREGTKKIVSVKDGKIEEEDVGG